MILYRVRYSHSQVVSGFTVSGSREVVCAMTVSGWLLHMIKQYGISNTIPLSSFTAGYRRVNQPRSSLVIEGFSELCGTVR